jgi:serine/threonine protein kinase
MTDTSFTTFNVEPGSIIAGRYEVICSLGSGGVGGVFRVKDTELAGEEVALKLLHAHLAKDENIFKRFRNEVLVARSLTHPNIVRTHDFGRAEQGFSYISMEIVDGCNLKDKISETIKEKGLPPFSFEEALAVLFQIVNGSAYAHDKGVVHRDLKPANVLLGPDGEIKLADFGTARIVGLETSLTQTGQAIGTPDYMSPEQIRGEVPDARCDIYSLGIIAYELVTGVKPFNAETSVAMAFKHINEPMPDVTEHSEAPAWFRDIVFKCGAKDRESRFDSAKELLIALSAGMPELSTSTGAYNIGHTLETTAGYAATNTMGVSNIPDNVEDTSKSGFQLGNAARRDNAPAWSLSGAVQEKEEALLENNVAQSVNQPAKKTSSLHFVRNSFFIVIFALLAIRFIEPVHTAVELEFHKLNSGVQQDLAPIVSYLAIEPQGNKAVQYADNRSELTAELLLEEEFTSEESEVVAKEVSKGGGSSELKKEEKNETKTTLPQENEKQVPNATTSSSKITKKEVEKDSPNASEIAATEPEKTDAVIVSNTEAPQVKEPIPTKGLITLSKLGKNEPADDFSIDELYRVKWKAEFESTTPAWVKENTTLNIFDPTSASLVAKLQPREATKQKNNGVLSTGTFSTLQGKQISTGQYRADLVSRGEVLSSTKFSLHKASIVLSGENRTSSRVGQERISIARLPQAALVTSKEPEPEPKQLAHVAPEKSIGSNVVSDIGKNASSIDLMRKDTSEELQESVPKEQTPSPPALPSGVVEERYRGTLMLPMEQGSNTRVEKQLAIDLLFRDKLIGGRAFVEGYGKFKVEGNVLPRGLELRLIGVGDKIRLISGPRRGSSLRGTYLFPTISARGTWRATLIE